jgi:hypothetical protein
VREYVLGSSVEFIGRKLCFEVVDLADMETPGAE